jgi:ribosomal protein S18 acetylase RimI-like enzyme
MSVVETIRRTLKDYRPKFGTAFLTYLDLPSSTHEQALDTSLEARVVESSSDPLLARFAPRWQQKVAGPRLDAGDWYALVILDGDTIVGHFWATLRTGRGLFNGMMNVSLQDDESYGFDLYISPEYRRGSIGAFVADTTIAELQRRGAKIGYTHLIYDNAESVLWHDSIGFNWVQVFNYFNFGPRIWWKIPFSESPRFGPLSRKGRHTQPEPSPPFGGSLLPK